MDDFIVVWAQTFSFTNPQLRIGCNIHQWTFPHDWGQWMSALVAPESNPAAGSFKIEIDPDDPRSLDGYFVAWNILIHFCIQIDGSLWTSMASLLGCFPGCFPFQEIQVVWDIHMVANPATNTNLSGRDPSECMSWLDHFASFESHVVCHVFQCFWFEQNLSFVHQAKWLLQTRCYLFVLSRQGVMQSAQHNPCCNLCVSWWMYNVLV